MAKNELLNKLTSKWQSHFDQTSGFPFFYNTETGETQWDPPKELIEALKDSKIPPPPLIFPRIEGQPSFEEFKAQMTGSAGEQPQEQQINYQIQEQNYQQEPEEQQPVVKEKKKRKRKTDEIVGDVSKLNSILDEVDEEKNKQNGGIKSVDNGDWVEEWDPKYKHPFYFNKVTNESRWEAPPGFTSIYTPADDDESSEEDEDEKAHKMLLGDEAAKKRRKLQEENEYIQRGAVNPLSGVFEAESECGDYWQTKGMPSDREGRQMHYYFDTSKLSQNRLETKLKQKEMLKTHNWRKHKKIKKKEKEKRQVIAILADH
eukprot:TRINITY_DN910_c0_g1_i1.p1 TRINITY_DN910_c0_g1~~TRINITY_DN910_c0_g1_i1.p1  ORF type:complete len:316 (+),score=97.01 TRINITY_DN910_c0_g1_i1:81-1028(+)